MKFWWFDKMYVDFISLNLNAVSKPYNPAGKIFNIYFLSAEK